MMERAVSQWMRDDDDADGHNEGNFMVAVFLNL